ncbi:MAG: Crp/Fnr family transcriptional regulator [Mucilaginibacter sp.]
MLNTTEIPNDQTSMVYTGIEKALNRIGTFSLAEVELVMKAADGCSVKKHEVILAKGQVCSFVIIVISGSLRLFHANEEKEYTLNFFSEYDFAADHESFSGQKPSANVIAALEDSFICKISIYRLHEFIAKNQAFLAMGRVMENWTKAMAFINLQTPRQRFEKLMELHPVWLLRFPQKHLASYLGMAPETFSRMKRKSLFS